MTATGVHVPVGRAQADEGRHDIDAVAIGDGRGQLLGLGRAVDQFQLVAQPLHRGPGDEDAAFQGVFKLAVYAPGNGRQRPVF